MPLFPTVTILTDYKPVCTIMSSVVRMERAESSKCLAARRFDFEYAATVFEDEDRLEEFNREAQDGELRYCTIGRAAFSEILYVSSPGENMKISKKSAASSQRDGLVRKSGVDIKKFSKSISARTMSEALRARGEEPSESDLKEMPELTPNQLNGMYRPVKTSVTVRLDADVLHWLKLQSGKYQTKLNATLRAAMLAEMRR